MNKVDGFVWKSEHERLIRSRLAALDVEVNEAVAEVDRFKDAKDEGKARSSLLSRRNKNLTRAAQGSL